jgi:hypothetical protein
VPPPRRRLVTPQYSPDLHVSLTLTFTLKQIYLRGEKIIVRAELVFPS